MAALRAHRAHVAPWRGWTARRTRPAPVRNGASPFRRPRAPFQVFQAHRTFAGHQVRPRAAGSIRFVRAVIIDHQVVLSGLAQHAMIPVHHPLIVGPRSRSSIPPRPTFQTSGTPRPCAATLRGASVDGLPAQVLYAGPAPGENLWRDEDQYPVAFEPARGGRASGDLANPRDPDFHFANGYGDLGQAKSSPADRGGALPNFGVFGLHAARLYPGRKILQRPRKKRTGTGRCATHHAPRQPARVQVNSGGG